MDLISELIIRRKTKYINLALKIVDHDTTSDLNYT